MNEEEIIAKAREMWKRGASMSDIAAALPIMLGDLMNLPKIQREEKRQS